MHCPRCAGGEGDAWVEADCHERERHERLGLRITEWVVAIVEHEGGGLEQMELSSTMRSWMDGRGGWLGRSWSWKSQAMAHRMLVMKSIPARFPPYSIKPPRRRYQ